jgi:wyosine [tRNA(Phe)-imidazoG37] synthetase (radical SAM superfamily)
MELISGPDHRRDAAGMTYVYAVVSRRANGISIGVNLNPNNACNWRCIYCQVPGLVRGAPPAVNLGQLGWELRSMLTSLASQSVAARPSRIEDVAFSGNGESTLSPMFAPAVRVVRDVMREMDLHAAVKFRLITNGSRVLHAAVQEGLREIAAAGGEVWFKVDGGSRHAIRQINDVQLSPRRVGERLAVCASLVPTWVQTCVVAVDGVMPDECWLRDYLAVLDAAGSGRLKGVLLYGLARPSQQPEAGRLSQVPANRMEVVASTLRQAGLTVRVSP